jgi:hypothetical protein
LAFHEHLGTAAEKQGKLSYSTLLSPHIGDLFCFYRSTVPLHIHPPETDREKPLRGRNTFGTAHP